jgi:hypothetical protein
MKLGWNQSQYMGVSNIWPQLYLNLGQIVQQSWGGVEPWWVEAELEINKTPY